MNFGPLNQFPINSGLTGRTLPTVSRAVVRQHDPDPQWLNSNPTGGRSNPVVAIVRPLNPPAE